MNYKSLHNYRIMGVLLVIILFVSCDSQNLSGDIVKKISDITISHDMTEDLDSWVSSRIETEELFDEYSYDLFKEKGILKDVTIINSYQDGLGNFDFNLYSLVVLRIVFEDSGYSLDSLSLGSLGENYIFDLYFHKLSSGYAAITPYYFWRVFDKLENNYNNEININILSLLSD